MTISQRRALNRAKFRPHVDNWMRDSAASDKRKLLANEDMRWPVVAIVCAVVVGVFVVRLWVS